MVTSDDTYLTEAEVAEHLRCSVDTVRRMRRTAGELVPPVVLVGRHVRWRARL